MFKQGSLKVISCLPFDNSQQENLVAQIPVENGDQKKCKSLSELFVHSKICRRIFALSPTSADFLVLIQSMSKVMERIWLNSAGMASGFLVLIL